MQIFTKLSLYIHFQITDRNKISAVSPLFSMTDDSKKLLPITRHVARFINFYNVTIVYNSQLKLYFHKCDTLNICAKETVQQFRESGPYPEYSDYASRCLAYILLYVNIKSSKRKALYITANIIHKALWMTVFELTEIGSYQPTLWTCSSARAYT